MIREGFTVKGELWFYLEARKLRIGMGTPWEGCGGNWFFEEVWSESQGLEAGMSQAGLGSRDKISLPVGRVLGG